MAEPISMTALLLPSLISGAASLFSSFMQQGNNAAAQKVIDDLTEQYGPEARALIERELGGPSAFEGLTGEQLAPEAVAAQREALRRMQQVAAGGYTPEEEAALRNIQAQTAAQAAGQQASLLEQFQRRGAIGSGAQLAMAQQAGQAAANRAGMQGLNVAAEAQRRAFQAMQGLGSQAGALRQDTVAERQRIAAAEEARKMNRMQAGLDVGRQMYRAQTLGAERGAGIANDPWAKGAAYVAEGAKAATGYLADEREAERKAAAGGVK